MSTPVHRLSAPRRRATATDVEHRAPGDGGHGIDEQIFERLVHPVGQRLHLDPAPSGGAVPQRRLAAIDLLRVTHEQLLCQFKLA
jgi:hypothetical protein